MAILVTGGAGFIGSHIVDKLISKNFEVIVVDNLITGKLENLNPLAKFYNLDITYPELEKIFINDKIDYVYHEAAQASVGKSDNDPYYDASVNVLGAINLFRLCKKYKVKKTIIASTAAVYGNPEYLPVDEKHKTKVLSFYGLSKLSMEHYIKQFGINYVIFRYSNVYGPRQDAEGEAGVISIFIDKILKDETLEIHGTGLQSRDFIYVKDVVSANVRVLDSNVKNEVINLSTNCQINLLDLASLLKNLVKSNINLSYTHPRNGDIEHSVLDNTKAKSLLNWSNVVSLHQGLYQTLEWKNKLINHNKSLF